tara:strand:- start:106 stop:405 length:300 start_codon:yes stop_codon:yes gene_type:complete
MKKFADIKFKKHRVIEGAIQGLLMLDNGIELSVVAGSSLYSLPGGGFNEIKLKGPEDVEKFEVAIIDQDGKFISNDDGDDTVLGWQSRSDIDKLIEIWS